MLSQRQKEYATYLSKGLSPLQAAKKAGYANPSKSVSDLKSSPEIFGYLSALQDKPIEPPEEVPPEVMKDPTLFLKGVMAAEIDASSNQIKAAIALLVAETKLKGGKSPIEQRELNMIYKRRCAPAQVN